MSVRRLILYAGLTFSLAALAFSFGSWTAQRAIARQLASNDARVAELRDDMARAILEFRQAETAATPSGTNGRVPEVVPAGSAQPALVEEIKRQLQSEMGLLPLRLLRERRESFVELNAYDASGKSSYGTAGYLGNGYFVTVKHAVVALDDPEGREGHKITAIKLRIKGRDVPARIVDAGDADVEVHAGDWAIVKVSQKIDLPPLRVNPRFTYDFADPIFRLGNDYSKGIILSTGYVGQRTSNGLVTCLTDGHPGVSGGGVLDQDGDLVGIPIGRMQGDYRFSFILPVRGEMFRKVPGLTVSQSTLASAE
ncbi:MAG TPA: serine protease [Vicinamibacterales bacterium]|nr:serine protease [Vicinamibacterales bacterium]